MKHLTLALIALASCAAPGYRGDSTYRIDGEFIGVVEEFEAHYSVEVRFSVVRATLPAVEGGTMLGQCTRDGANGAGILVQIAPKSVIATPAAVKAILWHELGHCALGLDHFDGEIDIMNSNASPMLNALKYGTFTWDELLNGLDSRIGY